MVRQASATPEVAVDFFTKMLHPMPQRRMSITAACQHPYVREAVQRLDSEMGDSATHPAVPVSTQTDALTASSDMADSSSGMSSPLADADCASINSSSTSSPEPSNSQPVQGASGVINIAVDCTGQPADAPPADAPPADAPPADAPPADGPPAYTPPAVGRPAHTSPADAPPVDADSEQAQGARTDRCAPAFLPSSLPSSWSVVIASQRALALWVAA